jgi:hypothetical protein
MKSQSLRHCDPTKRGYVKLVGKCACDHGCVWLQSSGRYGKRMYVAKNKLLLWSTGESGNETDAIGNNVRARLGSHGILA